MPSVPSLDPPSRSLLVSGAYSFLATAANGGKVQNSKGYDIVFTTDLAGANKLDHEIESYNPVTGAISMWVRVPTLSHTSDTAIYLQYGNSNIATSHENRPGVWDANFQMVLHLDEPAAPYKDSTGNGYASTGGTSPSPVTGSIGGGQPFSLTRSLRFAVGCLLPTSSFIRYESRVGAVTIVLHALMLCIMRWTLGAATLAALVSLLAGQAGRTDEAAFIYAAAPRYEAAAWDQGGERFPDGARLVLVAREGRHEVVPGFFASADAAVSYDGRRILFAGRPAKRDAWQIWEADLAGGQPHRVVTASGACIRPLYLPDGRVAYTRVTPSGSQIEVVSPDGVKVDVLTHAPGWYLTDDVLRDGRILFEWRGDLFTVYPDGTGVESLRCDHGPRRSGARQVSSGDVVFTVDGGLARFTSALAVQQKMPPHDWEIAGPVAELAPERWLVAARPHSGGAFAIHRAAASSLLESVESARGVQAVEPVVVAARVPPREFPSGLVPTRTTGNLLCLNAREAKEPVQGNIHAVRVYTRGEAGAPQLLGQTEVAPDGSFYVEVPADRPIRMELVDAAGARLRAEEQWFWMRPSEQRICVGCHAGPERAPENKVPEILNRILTSVPMLRDHGNPQ
jgi:hypothetical protein